MQVAYCENCGHQCKVEDDFYESYDPEREFLCMACEMGKADLNQITQDEDRVRNEETAQYLRQDPDTESRRGKENDSREVDSFFELGA